MNVTANNPRPHRGIAAGLGMTAGLFATVAMVPVAIAPTAQAYDEIALTSGSSLISAMLDPGVTDFSEISNSVGATIGSPAADIGAYGVDAAGAAGAAANPLEPLIDAIYSAYGAFDAPFDALRVALDNPVADAGIGAFLATVGYPAAVIPEDLSTFGEQMAYNGAYANSELGDLIEHNFASFAQSFSDQLSYNVQAAFIELVGNPLSAVEQVANADFGYFSDLFNGVNPTDFAGLGGALPDLGGTLPDLGVALPNLGSLIPEFASQFLGL